MDNEYTDFIDEVEFDVQPLPVISNPPTPPVDPTYVKVVSAELQLGSIDTAPLDPVFKIALNMPVNVETAKATISLGDFTIDCTILADNLGTHLTITPIYGLQRDTMYTLKLDKIVSKVGEYTFEEPFILNFKTIKETPGVQPFVTKTITENGNYTIEPDDEYFSMEKVNLTVDVENDNVCLYHYIGTESIYSTREIVTDGTYKLLIDGQFGDYECRMSTGPIQGLIFFEKDGETYSESYNEDGNILR